MRNKKRVEDFGFILNKLWVTVVVICALLILFGLVSNFFSFGIVLLSPEDARVRIEVVSDNGSFKQAVNFVLVGVVASLFLVMIVLLIILYLKWRKDKEKEIPQFDVFGMQYGLR